MARKTQNPAKAWYQYRRVDLLDALPPSSEQFHDRQFVVVVLPFSSPVAPVVFRSRRAAYDYMESSGFVLCSYSQFSRRLASYVRQLYSSDSGHQVLPVLAPLLARKK